MIDERPPIVAFIADEPGMAQNMLAAHVDDGTGHCRACTNRGVHPVWPCPLYGLAEQARRSTKVPPWD